MGSRQAQAPVRHAQQPSADIGTASGLWGCARAWVAQRLVALLAVAHTLGSCTSPEQASQVIMPIDDSGRLACAVAAGLTAPNMLHMGHTP